MKSNTTNHFQIIWGIILTLAGVLVFYRIPQVMPKLADVYEIFASGALFLKFSFYFIAIILIGGGIKKVYDNVNKQKQKNAEK